MENRELKEELVNAVRKHVRAPHCRIFLFGSRANGGGTERSDYDVGLETGGPIPLDDLAGVKSAMEDLPVMAKVDVVDFGRVTETFRKVAMSRIEVLYER
jgi:predicted nucleotidyltransferase